MKTINKNHKEELIKTLEGVYSGLSERNKEAKEGIKEITEILKEQVEEIELIDNEATRHNKTPKELYSIKAIYKLKNDTVNKSFDKLLTSFINQDFIKLPIADNILNRGSVFTSLVQEIIDQVKYEHSKEVKKLKKLFEGKQKEKLTKFSIHAMSQFYGDNKQLSLFSDEKIDAFSRATGLSITNRPDSYGVVLNQSQRRVLEGILKAFTDSNYKGDEEIDKATALKEVYTDTENSAKTLVKGDNAPYRNIDKIPVVRLTQAEIIKLSGHNRTQGEKVDVVEAITFLATNQFCFYWVRTIEDNKGNFLKDKKGDYLKEEVMEVGTLFRIKTIRNESGELKYYEIHPSAPLLDQVSNYFLLVPNDWREEVKEITGKRASSYTYELLLWLRLQYEQIRRYNNAPKRKSKPFKISKSWEDVAIALKMPETMYKANRKRASKIIQEAYSVAIKLGYLVRVENNGATDILYLNESYYPKPGKLI